MSIKVRGAEWAFISPNACESGPGPASLALFAGIRTLRRTRARGGAGVDPATLVVQALVTGASAGLGDTATAAVSDGYSALKHALARRLSGRHAALAQLQAIEGGGSAASTDALVRELVAAGIVDDRLLADARHLLALADPDGSRTGTYDIDLREARGVQVGDGNTQHNTFH
jgi:hypothetical protein